MLKSNHTGIFNTVRNNDIVIANGGISRSVAIQKIINKRKCYNNSGSPRHFRGSWWLNQKLSLRTNAVSVAIQKNSNIHKWRNIPGSPQSELNSSFVMTKWKIVIASERSKCGNPEKLSINVNVITILDHHSRDFISPSWWLNEKLSLRANRIWAWQSRNNTHHDDKIYYKFLIFYL